MQGTLLKMSLLRKVFVNLYFYYDIHCCLLTDFRVMRKSRGNNEEVTTEVCQKEPQVLSKQSFVVSGIALPKIALGTRGSTLPFSVSQRASLRIRNRFI